MNKIGLKTALINTSNLLEKIVEIGFPYAENSYQIGNKIIHK
jgi:hypothetical protein